MCSMTMNYVPDQPQPYDSKQVEATAQSVLASDIHLLNYTFSCCYREGTLILRGRVRRYYHKQIAQTIVSGIDGVERIQNQIEVDDSQSDGR